jgi:predicted Zn-dependent protease
MKYKILFFVFFIFLLGYLYISYLNQETVKFYVGNRQFYENTIADFVVFAFVIGVIFTFVLGFFFDLKRFIGGWREERRGKKMGELQEILDKARSQDLRGDREKAMETLDRLIRRVPEMEEPYYLLADMHLAAKDDAKALDVLNIAEMNLKAKEPALMRKAKLLAARKETAAVESVLKNILKGNESNVEALTMLRDSYVTAKNWNAALETQVRLRKFVKTEEELRKFLGIRYEMAKEAYSRGNGAALTPLMKELKEIIGEDKRFIPAYVLLAALYREAGKLNDAGRVYGRGYSKTGHIIFLLKMEDLYIDRGDPGVILKIYRRILDISPRNHLISFLYARLCLRLEMIDEAIDMLNTLFAEGKSFAGLHRAMAEAYAHRGEMAEAVEEFKKAFPMERVYIPFRCDTCHAVQDEWGAFCRSCLSWNSINVRTEEFLPGEPAELRAIYEREALGEEAGTDEV